MFRSTFFLHIDESFEKKKKKKHEDEDEPLYKKKN